MISGFEWDPEKRRRNLERHGLDFVRACAVFDGRPVLTLAAPYPDEPRWISTALLDELPITVIWTLRGTRIRIISARAARRDERQRLKDLRS